MMGLPITLTITAAGLDALVDAGGGATDPIVITEIGLSEAAVSPAPTIDALAGEFKRLSGISGQSVAENVIHLTAQDSSDDIYSLRSFALYLEDGTLFAVYGQGDPIFTKVSIASFLIALDVAFSSAIADDIAFGDALFLYPPATESVEGVARIATQARVDAEADAPGDENTIVTPKTLRARLAGLAASVTALLGRTISGGGLVTGGGNLSANRTLTVTAASAAQLQAASAADVVATPASFGALPRATGPVSYEVLPGGTLIQRGLNRVTTSDAQQSASITFPVAFADTDYDLQLTAVIPGASDYDNYPQEIVGTRSTTGVTIFLQDPSSSASSVLAGFNWRAEGRA